MEKCPHCGKSCKNLKQHIKMAHPKMVEKKDESNEDSGNMGELFQIVKEIANNVEGLSKRVDKIETGGKYEFKEGAKKEDIETARETRADVDDPKIANIVNELLGEDFGIRVDKNQDKPGFMFRVVVPPRLSIREESERPVRRENATHNRDYDRNSNGELAMEKYQPEDIRSRAVSSTDSYEAIRDHCKKVQANIVAWHNKMNKPIPEFKVK